MFTTKYRKLGASAGLLAALVLILSLIVPAGLLGQSGARAADSCDESSTQACDSVAGESTTEPIAANEDPVEPSGQEPTTVPEPTKPSTPESQPMRQNPTDPSAPDPTEKPTAEAATVTLDYGGLAPADSVQAEVGSKLWTCDLPKPHIADYHFRGWYLDASFTQKAHFPYKVGGDVKLYAKYEKAPKVLWRFAGPNRYVTATQTWIHSVPSTVYVATGTDYPDALASAAIAGKRDSALVLVEPNKVPEEVTKLLQEKKSVKKLVFVGGPGAVSADVQREMVATASNSIGSKVNQTRIGGANRFQTAAQLATDKFQAGAQTVYLANGMGFPDALAGGAAASFENAPVLLTMTNKLPEESRQALAQLKPKKLVVIGGEGVVSSQVAKQAAAVTGADLVRYGGANRFETAQIVAQKVFGNSATHMNVIANGMNFPDALVGSAYAGAYKAPILLTLDDQLPPQTSAVLQKSQPRYTVVMGGYGVVSTPVVRQIAKETGSTVLPWPKLIVL